MAGPMRSPSGRGFVQLGDPNATDIPLSTVRSNASSTGARRPNMGGTLTGLTSNEEKAAQQGDGKHHFFHRGRRQKKKATTDKPTRSDTLASDEFSLNFMGQVYNKVIGFSVVTRYLVYIVPVGLLLAVPLIVLKYTGHKQNPTVGHGLLEDGETKVPGPPLFQLFFWIEITWLCLWAAKLAAHILPPLFMFFTGVVSAGTRKYATVIRALELPLSLFFSALAAWISFERLIKKDFDHVNWCNTLRKILISTFISSGILLAEKTLVQLISITYHQRSFAGRIKNSKREIHLLGLLYDASRTLFPMYSPEFEEEDYIINDSIELMLGGGKKKGHKKNGSIAPMDLIVKAGGHAGRLGDKVTSVFGHVASEITGKQVFNPNSAHSIVIEALEKHKTSEALARRIWMSFVVEGNEALYSDDIVEVLGDGQRDEAEEAFAAIDNDLNGDISLDEMIRKVVEMGTERKAITHSMKDIGQALGAFDKILLFVVFLLSLFVFLSFFVTSFIGTVGTASTALLSMSFVFAATAQEFLGSCIFLFVKHPYDVGDRVDIVGSEKEALVVEKISLLYTVFNRIDKMQVVQVPNIVLNNLWIENVSRSKAMKETLEINVSYDTTFEDIELLRLEMETFVRSSEHSRDFFPDVTISVSSVGDCDKMTLVTSIKHKSNWHNDAVRAGRRSKFMCALVMALKKVPIYGPGGGGDALGGPANPSYSVAVSDSDAAAARKKADDDRQAGRLANQRPGDEADKAALAEKRENDAATGLNTINPVSGVNTTWGYNRVDDDANDEEDGDEQPRRSTDTSRSRLRKTFSQRGSGRRRAGESLSQHDGPPATSPPMGSTPNFQVTEHMSPFDEEAQLGSGPYNTQESAPAYSYGPTLQPTASTRLGRGGSRSSGARQRGSSISNHSPERE